MIMDGLLLFSSAQIVTASADSTNILDLTTFRDLGITERPLKLFVKSPTSAQAAGAATVTVSLQGSTDNSTYTTMWTSTAIPKASITTGSDVVSTTLPRPVPGQAIPRYLKLNYAVATGPLTAGTFTGALVLDHQANIQYPSGINVAN